MSLHETVIKETNLILEEGIFLCVQFNVCILEPLDTSFKLFKWSLNVLPTAMTSSKHVFQVSSLITNSVSLSKVASALHNSKGITVNCNILFPVENKPSVELFWSFSGVTKKLHLFVNSFSAELDFSAFCDTRTIAEGFEDSSITPSFNILFNKEKTSFCFTIGSWIGWHLQFRI